VGYHAARFLTEAGCRLVGVSEREGTLLAAKGLALEDVMAYRREKGTLLGFPGATSLEDPSAVLETECDILVPAALEQQIHAGNAGRVKARAVAEAANGPVTFDAADVLEARRIMVIPDLYLNAGGVTVSYFEWLKNLSHVRFGRMDKRFQEASFGAIVTAVEKLTGKTLDAVERSKIRGASEVDIVYSGLEETMTVAFQEISERFFRDERITTLRTAAFSLAIDKVARAYLELGIFP
jgi:glutamate dehydrogenase (NAD(P)+)